MSKSKDRKTNDYKTYKSTLTSTNKYLKYFRDYPLADWSFKKYRRCFPTATKLQAKYLRNLQTVKAHSKNIPQEAREQINSLVDSFNSMDTPVVNNIYGDSYNVNFVSSHVVYYY